MKKISIIILTCAFLMTGCWDKVELEERGIVISIGIDSLGYGSNNHSNYAVSMIIPEDYNIVDAEDDEQLLKVEEAETVNRAINKIDNSSKQALYYGHTKVCLLGSSLLENSERFKEAVDSLERNRELSRKILVLATKRNAYDIHKIKPERNTLLGLFITSFYQNNKNNLSSTINQDLETVINDLLATSNTVIPEIESSRNETTIKGLAIIKDYELAGWLDEHESMGYLWLTDNDMGGTISVGFEDGYIPLRIDKKETNRTIFEEDGKVIIEIFIDIKGDVDEYSLNKSIMNDRSKLDILELKYEEFVKDTALETAYILQKEMKVDVIGFKEHCRKNNYSLYKELDGNWNEVFENVEIQVGANVEIKGAGSVK